MDTQNSRAALITVFVTLMICLTIMACALLVADQIGRISSRGDIIAVKGYAERFVESDWAEWYLTASTAADTRTGAVEAGKRAETVVLEFLTRNGIRRDQIFLPPMEIDGVTARDAQGNPTNRIEYYVASVTVRVSTPDTLLVEKLSRDAVLLNGAECSVDSRPPSYLIRDIEQYKLELLHNATQSAGARAREIVLAGNGRLGPLKAVYQGVFQVTTPQSVDVSGYGEYDTTTRQKKISLVVTAEYGLGR